MNCDLVFDVLTRGPFPTGGDDDSHVERHLAGCPSCRELAAALRPAIELFEEALRDDEKRSLPHYRGPWSADWEASPQHGVATQFALEPPRISLPRSQHATVRWPALAQMASLAAGLLIGLFAYGAVKEESGRDRHGLAATTSVSRADALEHGVTLACFASPKDGRSIGRSPKNLPPADKLSLACCTHCHSAGSAAAPIKRATIRVATSCQLCHAE